MSDRSTTIEVPDRRADEADASAEQLEVIRQLVAGMSIAGFRIDYRRLGAAQASSVIDQLTRSRQFAQPVRRPGRGGCVTRAARSMTSLLLLLVVLAGIGGGVYVIYNKMQSRSGGGGSAAASGPDEGAGGASSDGGRDGGGGSGGNGSTFFGLDAGEDPEGPDKDWPNATIPAQRPEGYAPSGSGAGTTDNPAAQSLAARQLDQLERLIVQLSQFTRKEYDLSVRARSASGMQAKLGDLSAAMGAIRQTDPALADLILGVIDAYGAPQIDGPGMREQIDAIRSGLERVRQKL